jgi:hypothetical protein
MRHAFSNNAVTTLAAGISDSATTITLTSGAAFAGVGGPDGLVQALTITDPANVLPPEVVHATAMPGAGQRTVTRGEDGTTAQTWDAGAIVSARVTAGMLHNFAQVVEGALSLDASGIRGRNWLGENAVQTGGFPVLQLVRSNLGGSSDDADGNVSREVVGGTLHLNLGTTATWASGVNYGPHSVVVSPTPDSRQYCYEPSVLNVSSETTTTPSFMPDESCPALQGAGEVGNWVSINPAALEQEFSAVPGDKVLVVTEVGFVCTSHGGGSAPVVSIGADSSPTRFASGVALSQITAAGHVHRIPVSVGGAACNYKLKFSLVTPSSGDFRGRFYWKGFFLELAV